ncbi:hypothetical protein QBC40DRAFT_314473 [Triangularia verruculosa]|uniref:Uncharacterized protein n=1 Tax=Triangularia verruculosa TaxID=2587418 RepID=A0AAN6XN72_9PEZI|nr:hypothetical protein QBC40DRAFT_314473 [Triangularia verruculosa]
MSPQKRLKAEHGDAPESKRAKSETDDFQVSPATQSSVLAPANQPAIKPEPQTDIAIKHETEDSSTRDLNSVPVQPPLTERQAMEALGLLNRHCRIRIRKTHHLDPKSREWMAAQAEMMLAESIKHHINAGYEKFKAKECKDQAYKYALQAMQLPSISPQEYRARVEREFDEAREERRKKRIEESTQREKEGLDAKPKEV